MESVLQTEMVSFETLLNRLISAVNCRIKNGEYTERGLARILGVSQPQMHNVLKGARTLHADLADRLLWKLEISVLHLLEEGELPDELRMRVSVAGLPTPKKPAGQEFSARPHDRAV